MTVNYQNVEIFLTIVQEGGITQAAERLFITQSNVSKQLKRLEEELGVTLINREKGMHSAHLTPEGERFLPVAQDYRYSHLRVVNFKDNENRITLKIASIDSLNASVLYQIYPELMKRLPNLALTVTTDQSDIIYDMVNRQIFDVGFVLTDSRWPNIVVKPFISQKFCLILYSEKRQVEKLSLKALDPKREIYQPFGTKFQSWHEYWWPNHQYQIQVEYDISGTQALFTEGAWTIVPETVALKYLNKKHFHLVEVEEALPTRDTYYIVNKHPIASCRESLQAFEQLLEEYKEGKGQFLRQEALEQKGD